jgi:glutamyl-tRNA synthetase
MKSNIRVRFAPSPTGPLHIGGVRTALYNYLFAKKMNGTFILRIEDTDQNRYVPGAEKYIIDSLNWCNIPFDEGPGKNEKYGPYRQSERRSIYKEYAERLVKNGNAYYAFDTSDQLNEHRRQHELQGKTFIYNWHNRGKGRLINSLVLPSDVTKKRIENGDDFVIRFKTPKDESLILHDEVRGVINIDTNILDDKVLFKSDGMPTYHLANIVDDYLMKISHVIRGEEWLPSLPLHVLLYNSFGWPVPKFAHLPLILKPVGKGKLSKRDGDKLGFPVFPLAYTNEKTGEVSRGYKEDGYFPDAFINMLSLLGWNPGTDQELFTLNNLISSFELSRVSKSGAKFNLDKTNWFNQQYLQNKTNDELSKLYEIILKEKGLNSSYDYINKVISLIKERAVFIKDFWGLSSYFFETPSSYNEKASKKQWKENTGELMKEAASLISSIDDFSSSAIEEVIKNWISSKEIGFGKIMQPLRLAIVGDMKGPHLFDIIEMIGKKETVIRIHKIINTLS